MSKRFCVILPAAGRSLRFGTTRGKLHEQIGDRTVLARSINAFAHRDDVAMVIVVTPGTVDHLPAKVRTCPGGPSRAHSVLAGLEQAPPEIEWVAIHDAARPLVSQGLIDRLFAAAREHGAAVPALPVSLTIREADGPLPAIARGTIARDRLWQMQTPQAMRRADLLNAFRRCTLPLEQVTDDAQLLELAGHDVWLIEGEEANLKITTPLDLRLARLLCGVPDP